MINPKDLDKYSDERLIQLFPNYKKWKQIDGNFYLTFDREAYKAACEYNAKEEYILPSSVPMKKYWHNRKPQRR